MTHGVQGNKMSGKPEDLSSIPRTHIENERSDPCKFSSNLIFRPLWCIHFPLHTELSGMKKQTEKVLEAKNINTECA